MPHDLGMTQLREAPTLDTFGARLAVVRQQLGGWNVLKTATLCGINAQSWRNWEAGGKVDDLEGVCRKISDATGFPYVWLMVGRAGLEPAAKGLVVRRLGGYPLTLVSQAA